jgi:ribonucleoside-diphosphate reductase alpha chain
MNVVKRSGTKEPLDVEKIHKAVAWACEGINNVSVSDVMMEAQPQFHNNIRTENIHRVIVDGAAKLINSNSNYQYVASKLLVFDLYQKVYGSPTPSHLYETVKSNCTLGVYDKDLLNWYSEDEWNIINGYIKHSRDYSLTYAAVSQILDKYLVQDRQSKKYYETPQIMFILIAAVAFRTRPNRLKLIKDTYNLLSTFKISLPTPILAGLRTTTKQFSSCVLMDIGDDLSSITDGASAITKYAAKRAGLGINGGRIRAVGSKVGNGEIVHTGVTPFYRQFESALKSCSQGGIRDASSTVYAPVWHYEIEDILVLKNNKGTNETRVRRLDYSIQWDKFLLRKAVKNEDMALFSPHDVPDLYEAFFKKDRTEFETLYTKYAADKKIRKKVVKAREVLISFLKESQETGRVYLMFADNTNQQSPFKLPIYMSNLCSEISLPTKPIRNKVIQTDSTNGIVEFEGLVQLCTLGAVNLGNIDLDNTDDMQQRMYILVNLLNEVLDYQDYMLPQARRASMLHRPLGIGVINYAYFLAKNKLKYNDQESHDLTHRLAEQMYYYALRASVDLAAERGTALPGIDDTIYSEGKTLLDVYCKEVDSITNEPLHLDWDSLKADLAKFGVYNSTLLALMPSESSSTVSNATNGVEPIRAINTTKFNKKNTFVIVAPDANKVKYDFLWEMTPAHFEGYIRNMAVFQKFVCQAISTNLSYNPKFFPDEKISISVLLKDMILLAKYGLKTRYYVNTAGLETKDSNLPDGVAEEGDGCESGACKI